MKNFYRQRKKTINKPSKSLKKARIATHHDYPDHSKEEGSLRQFDMNMAYGPCLGMTRLERWERAQKLGLNPPQQVKILLKYVNVDTECLWHNRKIV